MSTFHMNSFVYSSRYNVYVNFEHIEGIVKPLCVISHQNCEFYLDQLVTMRRLYWYICLNKKKVEHTTNNWSIYTEVSIFHFSCILLGSTYKKK